MSNSLDNLRVLIVAEDPLVRERLAILLANQSGLMIAGHIAADKNLLRQIDLYHPDVVLWDFGLHPEMSIKHLDDLLGNHPPIVALISNESHLAEIWTENIRALLPREIEVESLAAALRAVAKELLVLDPELATVLVPRRHRQTSSPVEALTPRELEVLQLLAEGLANKIIANRLRVTEHTVKFHIKAIMGKLDAKSRTDAVVRASRLGLIII